ncbi:MAG TPA: hypothetical protein PLK31_04400 [Chloroflexota bacterium]|nr:hypothetical protein [Chloroflexota bacterium]
MDRTRLIFIAIVGVALLAVCGFITFSVINNAMEGEAEATAVAQSTLAPTSTRPVTVNLESPEPIWGPNYDAADGRPTFVCGADAFGSYFVLQQMQMSGQDIANGFHMGIVPFFLDEDPAYDVSEEQRTALLNAGILFSPAFGTACSPRWTR